MNVKTMYKIVILSGVPASGKSTWAKEQEASEGALRFNKDDIRKEMFPSGYAYSKENEKSVVDTERFRVEQAMFNYEPYIIIDNTHLGQNNPHVLFYTELAEKYGYDVENKFFYISLDEAIKRDKERPEEERVGEQVIQKMWKMSGNKGYPLNPQPYKENPMLDRVLIVDIDGTLAYMDGKRSPYDYEKAIGDRANTNLIEMLPMFKNLCPMRIVIMSGRDEECRKVTEKWLKKNNVVYDALYMRKKGDKRGDDIVKGELFEEHIQNKYNVFAVFDDRQKVVDLWRLKYGLPTYQCWYGYF